MCSIKDSGGLGVRRLREFKLALLERGVGGCMLTGESCGLKFWRLNMGLKRVELGEVVV